MNLQGQKIAPKKPNSLVIIMHGYGANGDDLLSLAHQWAQTLPATHFFCPNAPTRLPPFGFQWFAIDNIITEDAMADGCASIAPQLSDYFTQYCQNLGVPLNKLVLCGFSQGCMLAHYCGYRMAGPIGGVLGYSGGAPGVGRLTDNQTAIHRQTPYILYHGADDSVVSPLLAQKSHAIYQNYGINGEFMLENGLAHGISADGVALGTQFLHKIFTKDSR